jgi:lysyl-tRNA synthetase class 2
MFLAAMEELSELLALRRAKVDKLRALGVDPFGAPFAGTESSASIRAAFNEGRAVRFAGRVVSHRDMGKSHFMHLQDDTGRLQIYVQTKALEARVQEIFKLVDIGDFVGVDGTLFTTKTGEQSIHATAFHFLGKSLKPLPDKWHGLADVEQRYRQRYLDLAANPETKKVLTLRARMVREIRMYLDARGFLEVETPMMQPVAGGAAAQPFKTHHKALGMDLYLRIAPELYLKRLLVGGYEKVFELNRNFRNEGISRRHNPEFTMLELYQTYGSYEVMAALVEDLITHLAQTLNGSLTVTKRMEGMEAPVEINLAGPWKRRPYRELVREVAGTDWFELTAAQRRERAESLGVEIIPELEDFEVTNQVFEKLVEAKTIDPLFVTHLPKELVPLAKQNADDPTVVDVYELIIGGQEISPGYSELNDPIVQRQRLLEQAGAEVHKIDEDFLTALEHGMPPAGGLGLGVDRLAMLLTGADSIRDVILFPLMRPRELSG